MEKKTFLAVYGKEFYKNLFYSVYGYMHARIGDGIIKDIRCINTKLDWNLFSKSFDKDWGLFSILERECKNRKMDRKEFSDYPLRVEVCSGKESNLERIFKEIKELIPGVKISAYSNII